MRGDRAEGRNRLNSMMYPPDTDPEDLPPHLIQTMSGRLRKFHIQFESSIRALLQQCLFREVEEEGTLTLQILCPNEVIFKRLVRKQRKIRNMVDWVWRETQDYVALCVQKDEKLECQIFGLKDKLWQ